MAFRAPLKGFQRGRKQPSEKLGRGAYTLQDEHGDALVRTILQFKPTFLVLSHHGVHASGAGPAMAPRRFTASSTEPTPVMLRNRLPFFSFN